MDLFGHLEAYDYGEVHFKLDKATGLQRHRRHPRHAPRALRSAAAASSTTTPTRPPLVDALRLARGMTYKAALAGLPHGGGKSVLIRPTQHFDRVALFRAFGKFIDDLRGHYITAEDSGTGLEDMEVIRSVTK